MIRIQSPQARRIAAKHFAEHEPFLLELLKAFAPVEEVSYSGRCEEALKAELVASRNEAARQALKEARESLN